MAQFQQIVLDYWASFEPERFEELKRRRALRQALDSMVQRLYDETDRIYRLLRAAAPEASLDYHRCVAEQRAIASLLPALGKGESTM